MSCIISPALKTFLAALLDRLLIGRRGPAVKHGADTMNVLQVARAEFARRLELAQAAHEMDMAAFRQELAEARQAPERRRSTHPRGSNGHVPPHQRQ